MRTRNPYEANEGGSGSDDFDLDALLYPGDAFERPVDVVNDPDLTTYEKRAILASWASDACAVDAMPALRTLANGRKIPFDEVLDALKQLDRAAGKQAPRDSRRQPSPTLDLRRNRPDDLNSDEGHA